MWMILGYWSGFILGRGRKSMLSTSICLFHSLIMGMQNEMKAQHKIFYRAEHGTGELNLQKWKERWGFSLPTFLSRSCLWVLRECLPKLGNEIKQRVGDKDLWIPLEIRFGQMLQVFCCRGEDETGEENQEDQKEGEDLHLAVLLSWQEQPVGTWRV